jgi:hypothetical protein
MGFGFVGPDVVFDSETHSGAVGDDDRSRRFGIERSFRVSLSCIAFGRGS